MVSSSSRMPLASSRAMARVLSSARSAASGTVMSLPRLAERLVDGAGLTEGPVVPGDDGGDALGADGVEVKVYLLGSAQRPRLRRLYCPSRPPGQRPSVLVPYPAAQDGCQ